MRRINVVGVLAAVMAVGCGPTNKNGDGIADGVRQPTDVLLTAPSTPTGTISGQVMDTQLQPLSGVTVSLNGSYLAGTDGGVLSTTTDSNGNWSVGGVPAGGDIEVVINKTGFAPVHTTANINNSSGNVPQSNANAMVGPYTLTQFNSTLKFLIINSVGKPAAGAKAYIEATPTMTIFNGGGAGYGDPSGVVVASGTADANGVVSFSGLPGPDELARLSGSNNAATNYTVTVPAIDFNGDGIPDSAGSVTTYSAQQLVIDNTTQVITLYPARTETGGLNLLSTNVPSFWGGSTAVVTMVKPGDPIYMVFNHYLVNSAINVRLVDETGKNVVAISAPTLTSGSVLTITPSAQLQAGKEYNIAVHVVSLDDGEEADYLGYFFAGDPAGTPVTPDIAAIQFHDQSNDGLLNNGEVVDVIFNQPVATYNNPNLGIVFFNKDLDASGTIGNYPGELGYSPGTPGGGYGISRNEYWAEQGTIFVLRQSGYTTRYSFTYNGGSGGAVNIAPGTNVTVDFTRLLTYNRGLQTIWGQPYQTAITKQLTAVTP